MMQMTDAVFFSFTECVANVVAKYMQYHRYRDNVVSSSGRRNIISFKNLRRIFNFNFKLHE